jgi:hypothetical protein
MNNDYREGFMDGFKIGQNLADNFHGKDERGRRSGFFDADDFIKPIKKQKRKRTQSPKQKLLAEMTDKKWKVYKKGSGKKSYFDIRGQVSRSAEYKRKAKRL